VREALFTEAKSVLTQFLGKDRGHFLVASQDASLVRMVKSMCMKHLAVRMECATAVEEQEKAFQVLGKLHGQRMRLVLLLESVLEDRDTGFLQRRVQRAFQGDVRTVVITGDIQKDKLILFSDRGARNFIIRPYSLNTVVTKLASVVRPLGRFPKLVHAGQLLLERGENKKALELAQRLIELKPDNAGAYLLKGDAYAALNQHFLAVESYEQAHQHAKLFLDPLKRLVRVTGGNGDPERHLDYLVMLDDVSPLNPDRKVDLGEAYLGLGYDETAEGYFQRGLHLAAREAVEYIAELAERVGLIYGTAYPVLAEQYLRKSLAAWIRTGGEPEVEVRNRLGMVLRKQGKWEDAVDEYRNALRLAPDDEHLIYNLALALAEGKQFRDAAREADTVLQVNPELARQDAQVAFALARIFVNAGQEEKARPLLHRAMELDPDNERHRKLQEMMLVVE
jgi:tetratricopeptide (TPR) repeat protein